MTTCDHPQCTGHLGKFQSCRDEALWENSLDGWGREAGSVEFQGHYTLMQYDTDTDVTVGDRTVTIPAGIYVVENSPSGAIYAQQYDTLAKAARFMDSVDKAHAEWEDA